MAGWSSTTRGSSGTSAGAANAGHPGPWRKTTDKDSRYRGPQVGKLGKPRRDNEASKTAPQAAYVRGHPGKGCGARLHPNKLALSNQGFQDDPPRAHPSQLRWLFGQGRVVRGGKVRFELSLERETKPRDHPSGWRCLEVFSWSFS